MSFSAKHIPDLAGKKPGTLIHLGAGRCRELDTWREAGFRQIILVEPDPARTSELTSRVAGDKQIQIIEQAVSADDGNGELNVLNYPDASSLREPTRLLELFPGIRLRKRVACAVKGINHLLANLALDADADAVNGLVIETPGEEYAIAEALVEGDQLDLISFVLIQAPSVPLYKGAQAMSEIESLLLEAEFQIGRPDSTTQDPVRPIRSFQRDVTAIQRRKLERQIKQERAKRKELEKRLTENSEKLNAQKKALNKAQTELKEARTSGVETKSVKAELQKAWDERASFKKKADELEEMASAAKARSERLEKQLQEAEKKAAERAEAKKRAERLEQKLREAQDEIQRLKTEAASRPAMTDELQKLLQKQSEQLEKSVQLQKENAETLEKRFLSKILSRIDNSAKQVESYIGINTFLETGYLVPDLHGWPISPDLALYLIRLIGRNDYDLIIEFGSGSSTLLMAQALHQKALGHPVHQIHRTMLEEECNKNQDRPRSAGHMVDNRSNQFGTPNDILPRIVAFEHMREFARSTQDELQKAGVDDLVDIHHTALREYQARDGSTYLYYNCDEILASLASRSQGEKLRILVFVDGPPANSGREARYPALPVVLEHFGASELDLVLDDTNREDETAITRQWKEESRARGLSIELVQHKFEKGAITLAIR